MFNTYVKREGNDKDNYSLCFVLKVFYFHPQIKFFINKLRQSWTKNSKEFYKNFIWSKNVVATNTRFLRIFDF